MISTLRRHPITAETDILKNSVSIKTQRLVMTFRNKYQPEIYLPSKLLPSLPFGKGL